MNKEATNITCAWCGKEVQGWMKFCPHCGAPLDLNQSGVCSYCHSVVTSDDHDWVLTKIEGIMQRTM